MKVYGIIKANSLDKLEKRINYLSRNGFDLHGDIKMQQDFCYFQAVVYDVMIEDFATFCKNHVDSSEPSDEEALKFEYEKYIDNELQKAKDKIKKAKIIS